MGGGGGGSLWGTGGQNRCRWVHNAWLGVKRGCRWLEVGTRAGHYGVLVGQDRVLVGRVWLEYTKDANKKNIPRAQTTPECHLSPLLVVMKQAAMTVMRVMRVTFE